MQITPSEKDDINILKSYAGYRVLERILLAQVDELRDITTIRPESDLALETRSRQLALESFFKILSDLDILKELPRTINKRTYE